MTNFPLFFLALLSFTYALKSEDTTDPLAGVALTPEQEATLAVLAKNRDDAAAQVLAIQSAIEELDKEIAQLQEDINLLNSEATELESKINKALQDQAAWLAEIQALDLKINLQAQNEVKAKIDLIDSQIFALQQTYNVKLKISQARIDGLQTEIDDLTKDILEIQASLNEAVKQLDDYMTKEKEKKAAIDAKKDYIDNYLSVKVKNDTATFNKYKTDLNLLQAALVQARADKNTADDIQKRDKIAIDSYALYISSETGKRKSLKQIIEGLQLQLNSQQAQLATCEANLKSYNDRLTEATQEYQTDYQDFQEKVFKVQTLENSYVLKQQETDLFVNNTLRPEAAVRQTERSILANLTSDYDQFLRKVAEWKAIKSDRETQKSLKLAEKENKTAALALEKDNLALLTAYYQGNKTEKETLRANVTSIYQTLVSLNAVYQKQMDDLIAKRNASGEQIALDREQYNALEAQKSEKNELMSNATSDLTKKKNELTEALSELSSAEAEYSTFLINQKSSNAQETIMSSFVSTTTVDVSEYE